MHSEININSGYHQAIILAKSHYENFPVISLLIPRELRKHVAVVYWFARTADDLADENISSEGERLEQLNSFEGQFISLLSNDPANNLESALKNTIKIKKLNPENFLKLIKAFKQDVTKKRYDTFTEVLEYCDNSANPIGRIMLELFDIRNEEDFLLSDKICTALQITNFMQDTLIDYQKGRIYYPKEEMEKFGVAEKMFEIKENNSNLKALIEFSVDRVQSLFDDGKGLVDFLSGRFKYEIDWTIRGGESILNKIRGADFDVFTNRPVLTKSDHLKILLKVFFRL